MNQSDFEAIANGAYGGRVGNGSHSSGDGWLYRGRGLKQLTGRGNYRAFTLWHIRNIAEWPDEDLDFENNPDLLTQIKYAVRSAAFFWVTNGLHVQADLGPTSQTVEKITDIVNFHTDSNSRNKRINNFQSIWHNNYFI
jgi:predicted chitinase